MTIKIEDVYLSSRCAVLTRCIFPVSKHGTALGSTEMMSPESVGTLQDTCFAMEAGSNSHVSAIQHCLHCAGNLYDVTACTRAPSPREGKNTIPALNAEQISKSWGK